MRETLLGDNADQAGATLSRAALEQHRVAREADWKTWRAMDDWIRGAGDRLLGFGEDGVEVLRGLCKDETPHVRLAAARFLLWRDEKKARAALRSVLKEANLTGFMAHELLELWARGELVPPPSIVKLRGPT